jgi:tRNA wybutosine-synthesizing protein 4
LWGASLSWHSGNGLVIGGVGKDGICDGRVYTWTLDRDTVILRDWELSDTELMLLQRYSAKTVQLGEDEVLVVGGAGSHRVFPWSEQFVLLSTRRQTVRMVDVRHSGTVDPWFIGHEAVMQKNTRDIIIFGGGGVCFSFGSFWNDRILQLSQDTSLLKIDWNLLEETSVKVDIPQESHRREQSIRRVRINTPEDWYQIILRSEVCILEGLSFGECVNSWTPESLKEKVNLEKKVTIHETESSAMNFLAKNFNYSSVPFNTFIDCVFSSTPKKVYLRAVSDEARSKAARLEDDFPLLARDFKIPEILYGDGGIPHERIFSTVLRIGAPGTSMWLHYDVPPSRHV